MSDLIPRLPFGTFLTFKRAFKLLCEIGDALQRGRSEYALGMCAQGMRWTVASIAPGVCPNLAWNLTMLPDPLGLPCTTQVAATAETLLSEELQDPRQISAVIGKRVSIEAVTKKVTEFGGGGNKKKDKWWEQPAKDGADKDAKGKGKDGKKGKKGKHDDGGGGLNPVAKDE
jgi:hypothetical protein